MILAEDFDVFLQKSLARFALRLRASNMNMAISERTCQNKPVFLIVGNSNGTGAHAAYPGQDLHLPDAYER